MSPFSSSARNLFSPISFPQFVREYYEKKSLLVRGRARNRFEHVLSLAAIDEILSGGYLRYPQIKLVAGGSAVPLERYVVGDEKTGIIDIDGLLSEHAGGATIIINYLHRHWRPLSYLCRDLEQLLSVGVQSNIYLTPRFSQGFDAHYDTHDVIILQIAGTKNWRLYGTPVPLAGPEQPYRRPSKDDMRVRQKCTLRAGDCLYIPRGQLHDATASIEASLHVTIGLLTTTWGDALLESVKMLVRDEASLRQSLPPGFIARGVPKSLRVQAAWVRKVAAARLPIIAALETMADRFIAQRPQCLEGQFLEMQSPWLVDGATRLKRRPGVTFRKLRQRGKIGLQFYRKKLFMPDFVGPAVNYIIRARSGFRAADLPGDLTDDSKILLCRRLVQEGFLQTCSDAGGNAAATAVRSNQG